MERMFVLDGLSLLYRAHHAFARAPLVNSRGMETSGLFGFTQMLMTVLEREKPDYLVVAFDKGKETLRHGLYPQYKATRAPTPQGLLDQVPYAHRIVEAMNVPVVMIDLWEADDILGTLACRFAGPGLEVVLVSGDRDVLQLVGEHVRVVLTRKGLSDCVVYTPQVVRQELGLDPCQLIDLKALAGDPSDNIPGVPGVGPKTAQRLVAEYGCVDRLYEGIAGVRGALREKLDRHRDQAFLSLTLGTIRRDAPVDLDLEGCRVRPFDGPRLLALFTELELRRFLDRVEVQAPAEVPWRVIAGARDLAALASRLEAAPWVAVACALTSAGPMEAGLAGVALATGADDCAYVPLEHEEGGGPPPAETLAVLASALAGRPVVAADTKAVRIVLGRRGIRLGPPASDIGIASYLVDPARRHHSTSDLAADLLGVKLPALEGLAPRGRDLRAAAASDVARAISAHMGALLTLRERLETRVAQEQLGTLYRELELPLSIVLAAMEEAGVGVDTAALAALSREVGDEALALEQEAFTLAGEEFNLQSPQQLVRILFTKLGLPVLRRTEKGRAPSTDQDVLVALEREHGVEIARVINRHRHLTKLKSTYIDALPGMVNPWTGRIHTCFSQVVATTGRLSSSNPNLQNIPIRTSLGERIRRAFTSPPGHALVGGDLSQVELRVLAHLTGAGALAQGFREGVDVHVRTAALVFRVDPTTVTGEMRARAKAINFGILYGMSAFGLAQEVGMTTDQAGRFIEDYFAHLPEVKSWLDGTLEEARSSGQVTTLLGRRRRLPDLSSTDPRRRAAAERMAINTPVQGTAADLLKRAMVLLHDRLTREGWRSRMILTIHDELVCEAPADEVEGLSRLLRESMEGALALSVPLVAHVRSGPTWADLK